VPLILQLIADATRDPSSIPALEQDLRKRRYFGREVPNDGNLDWNTSAREVVRFIRAADYGPFSSPWGTPRARLGGRPVGILKASLGGEATDQPPGGIGEVLERGAVTVATSDEWIAVCRIQVEGRSVSPSDICSPGDRFEVRSENRSGP
jgi:methionyl-tRNA formyltransferase